MTQIALEKKKRPEVESRLFTSMAVKDSEERSVTPRCWLMVING